MTQFERILLFIAGALAGGAIVWATDYYVYLQIIKELLPPV